MEEKSKRTNRGFLKLKNRYRILILEDATSAEKATFKAPLWVLINSSLAVLLIVFILFALLLRYTSLKEYFIGEDPGTYRRELLEAYDRIDSLDQQSKANELYLSNLQKVINGTVGESIDEAIKRDSEQIAREEQKPNLPKNKKDQTFIEDEAVLKSY